jgi:hypothetical protein
LDCGIERVLLAPELRQLPEQDLQCSGSGTMRASPTIPPRIPHQLVKLGNPLIHEFKDSHNSPISSQTRVHDLPTYVRYVTDS